MGLLHSAGGELTPNAEDAEILVVNTCSFIDSAKQESVNTILEMVQHKQANGGRAQTLIVAGCLVERYRDEIRKNIPEVDAVVGTGELEAILEPQRACLPNPRSRTTRPSTSCRSPICSRRRSPAAPIAPSTSTRDPNPSTVPQLQSSSVSHDRQRSGVEDLHPARGRHEAPRSLTTASHAPEGDASRAAGPLLPRPPGTEPPPRSPTTSTPTRRRASSPRRAPPPTSRSPKAATTPAASASSRSCAASSAPAA